ncbi:hypothetical protein Sjap_020637 [Stephania japonica]|uniref:Uncharacterized protein n=1 Tax=Stephania japonica TaxID=461633 RepID=A0AAP0F6D7_9MAGN
MVPGKPNSPKVLDSCDALCGDGVYCAPHDIPECSKGAARAIALYSVIISEDLSEYTTSGLGTASRGAWSCPGTLDAKPGLSRVPPARGCRTMGLRVFALAWCPRHARRVNAQVKTPQRSRLRSMPKRYIHAKRTHQGTTLLAPRSVPRRLYVPRLDLPRFMPKRPYGPRLDSVPRLVPRRDLVHAAASNFPIRMSEPPHAMLRLEQQRGDEGQVGYATAPVLSSSSDINLSTSTRIGIRVVRTRNRKTRVRVKDPVIGILRCERRANVINADRKDIGGSFAKHRQPQSQSIVGGDDDKLQRSCDMEMFGMDNTSRRDRDMFRDVLTVELRGIYIGNAR